MSLNPESSDRLPKTVVVERSGTQSDSITVIAEPEYQAGSFHRTFWGVRTRLLRPLDFLVVSDHAENPRSGADDRRVEHGTA